MFNSIKQAGLALILSITSQQALADEPWELIGTKNGTKVYSKEVKGTDLIAFKGVKIMSASIAKVAQVLLDEDATRKKGWIDMIQEFKILDKNANETISYSSYKLPWPLASRDYVISSKMVIDNEKNQIVLNLKSTEFAKAPETVGVRAELSRSLYLLVPKADGKTEVTVEILTDPKGSLPKWLVNIIQKGWPSNTLGKMEVEAMRPETIENPMVKAQFKGSREFANR